MLNLKTLLPLARFLARLWLLPYRYTALRKIFGPGKGADFEFEVNFFGDRYRGNIDNEIDWHTYFFGSYASEELFLLRDIARHLNAGASAPVIYCDVGANVGNHALFMSRHSDRVYCFEPYEKVLGRLYEKIRLNGIENVEIFEVALGNKNSVESYVEPPEGNMGQGSLAREPGSARADAPQVDVKQGDAYFAANHLSPPSILKIDVEGYEKFVLEGLHDTLHKHRPVILMELLGETKDLIQSSANLYALVYPNASIFEVRRTRRGNYRLDTFRFDDSREILVLPDELEFPVSGTR